MMPFSGMFAWDIKMLGHAIHAKEKTKTFWKSFPFSDLLIDNAKDLIHFISVALS